MPCRRAGYNYHSNASGALLILWAQDLPELSRTVLIDSDSVNRALYCCVQCQRLLPAQSPRPLIPVRAVILRAHGRCSDVGDLWTIITLSFAYLNLLSPASHPLWVRYVRARAICRERSRAAPYGHPCSFGQPIYWRVYFLHMKRI
jgi:hypothetical protein